MKLSGICSGKPEIFIYAVNASFKGTFLVSHFFPHNLCCHWSLILFFEFLSTCCFYSCCSFICNHVFESKTMSLLHQVMHANFAISVCRQPHHYDNFVSSFFKLLIYYFFPVVAKWIRSFERLCTLFPNCDEKMWIHLLSHLKRYIFFQTFYESQHWSSSALIAFTPSCRCDG